MRAEAICVQTIAEIKHHSFLAGGYYHDIQYWLMSWKIGWGPGRHWCSVLSPQLIYRFKAIPKCKTYPFYWHAWKEKRWQTEEGSGPWETLGAHAREVTLGWRREEERFGKWCRSGLPGKKSPRVLAGARQELAPDKDHTTVLNVSISTRLNGGMWWGLVHEQVR